MSEQVFGPADALSPRHAEGIPLAELWHPGLAATLSTVWFALALVACLAATLRLLFAE